MKAEEYFGDWIDKEELRRVVTWAEQGILMINTALTCEVGRVGAHFDIVNSLKTIEVYHPAYYARTGKKMPSSVFTDINQALKQQYNYQIEFYKETEYGTY